MIDVETHDLGDSTADSEPVGRQLGSLCVNDAIEIANLVTGRGDQIVGDGQHLGGIAASMSRVGIRK